MAKQPYVPPLRPNEIPPPPRDVYAQMGEENIRRMLSDFYSELEQSPLRHMFPKDMEAASQKSADFFIGLLGGPPLYHQRHGNPMMRARHLPFAIDMQARQIWLDCFETVLASAEEDYAFPAERLPQFIAFLRGFSHWMVNTQ